MFKSIVRAVSAHRQLVIAAVAVAGLVGYASPIPSALAQFFGIPGISISDGTNPNVSVNTDNVYIHIFDRTVNVNAGGFPIEIHWAGM